jgi:hypothetical protein
LRRQQKTSRMQSVPPLLTGQKYMPNTDTGSYQVERLRF